MKKPSNIQKGLRQADGTRPRYHVPNLARALAILELLAKSPPGAGVSQIASELSLPKNSVFRVVVTLHDHGYLDYDKSKKTYRLSRKFLILGQSVVSQEGLIEKSIDILRELRDATKETTFIATLVGEQGVILEQLPGLHPVKLVVEVGHRFPLHSAAPGKALVAFLPTSVRESLIRELDYVKFNERTIDLPRRMTEECERVRQLGYAVDHAEEVEDVHCVAAPVLDHRGYPIAAIWTSGPGWRMRAEDFDAIGKVVIEHAQRISQRFGGNQLALVS